MKMVAPKRIANPQSLASQLRAVGVSGMAAKIEAEECLMFAKMLDNQAPALELIQSQRKEILDLSAQVRQLRSEAKEQRIGDWYWITFGKFCLAMILIVAFAYGFE